MTEKYVCIHGHFYQPPRENPWLEEVEIQDSAYPYFDWNSRITAECYAPNTASRILDNERKIIDIVNNYSRISFNFSPTVLSWLEKHQPEIYQAILDGDKKSRELFSGHGSAIAQSYNHIIMPLASSRDKRTQVIWGIRDFEHRFKRLPEGMWLPETAADLETLEILAEHDIIYTLLAPHQALRARKIDGTDWQDVSGAAIDPRMPYRCNLPSGRHIIIFFYDSQLSREIAFGGLLDNGEEFAHRLVASFSKDASGPELVHCATDGETYGHHHRFGDMALAYCIYFLEAQDLARITVYGEYLEKHPPSHEVEIVENSSWSCVHGIERWRKNCGCSSGRHPGWAQEWRAPLRGALDWLRDNLALIVDERLSRFTRDPWQMRDDYIEVILDRSPENLNQFLSRNGAGEVRCEERVEIVKLLEMQRHALLMYSSCGWFFDEISGLETVQVLQYAARAVQLARETAGIALEDVFVNLLERAPGNIDGIENGAKVYRKFISPVVLDLLRVAVHYAVSSLFRDYAGTDRIYSYLVTRDLYERTELGNHRIAIGKSQVQSLITGEQSSISFAVLHLGDQTIIGGACEYTQEESFLEMQAAIKDGFLKGSISDVILTMDKHFKTHNYSLWHLFKNEQREVLNQIFEQAHRETGNAFRQIYEHHYSVMQAVEGLNMPLPNYFAVILEFVLNTDICSLLQEQNPDWDRLGKMVAEAKRWSLQLDKPRLSLIACRKINGFMQQVASTTENLSLMQNAALMLKSLEPLALDLNLWEAQNIYFFFGKDAVPSMREIAQQGDPYAQQWTDQFAALGNYLKVRIE
jgi:alpha-amylase/alpha-mannosidase (GH57 family)